MRFNIKQPSGLLKSTTNYEFTKLLNPAFIFPLNTTRTITSNRIYGGIIKKKIPSFKPLPHSPSLFSTTALQVEHNAKISVLVKIKVKRKISVLVMP
jgi:hypothetical protein